MEKILTIVLKLFTPNTLSCYGLVKCKIFCMQESGLMRYRRTLRSSCRMAVITKSSPWSGRSARRQAMGPTTPLEDDHNDEGHASPHN